MKPSERIYKAAQGNSSDFTTINGAGLSRIIVEIIEYLDEQYEKERNRNPILDPFPNVLEPGQTVRFNQDGSETIIAAEQLENT